LSATHIARILKVSRTWLFTIKKQFPEGAPKDFKDPQAWRTFVKAHRIEPVPPVVEKVSTRSVEDSTQESEPSAHSRYIAARAHRTEILAQMAEIELAATQRNMLPRGEVEAAFAHAGGVIKAHILRLANDAPWALVGKTEAEIDEWMQAAIRRPIGDIKLPPDFFEPRKIQT
jgi:hypothetical protein